MMPEIVSANEPMTWPENDLRLFQHPEGLMVSQGGDSYLARKWRLSTDLVCLVDAALDVGFACAIRHNHPRPHNRLPKGVEYLGFSRVPSERWVFVVDQFSCLGRGPRERILKVTFEQAYRATIERAGIPFEPEPAGGQNLFVPYANAIGAIEACAKDVEFVEENLGTRHWEDTKARIGFITESILESFLRKHWDHLPIADEIELLDHQVPVEGGYIDLLGRNRVSGSLVVIELKRNRVGPEVLDQLARYVNSETLRRRAGTKVPEGIVIARHFFPSISTEIPRLSFPVRLMTFGDSGGSLSLTAADG
jgi:hypothetical protein